MTDIAWIGIEEAAQGARGWGFDAGGTPCTEVHGDDAAAIRAKTPDTPALVVSDRAAPPARAVPAQVLPDSGALSPLTQAAPPGLLPATACLRLAGVLATRPQWDGVCLLPGTDVTHWVHVSAGEVVSFASFLTPRLAQLLGADAASPNTALLHG
jgi:2-dehydro-3-deoxygalactonokinase